LYVRAGEEVTITVEASDPDGSLRHVSVFIDGVLLGKRVGPPYEWTWQVDVDPPAAYRILARAEDDLGAQSRHLLVVNTWWIYSRPEQTDDGWETASMTEVGMDSASLEGLVNLLHRTPDHLVHGILVVRHGKLVFEKYFDGIVHPTLGTYPVAYGRETPHVQSSATKSFTSALLGIAIDKGWILGLDQRVSDFFPEFPWLAEGEKGTLTLRHMITMSAGLEWDQTSHPILDPLNDIAVFQRSPDPWEMYFSRRLLVAPGTVFDYSEACINVVGEAIKRATGKRLDHFAEEYLFDPLGVEDPWWYLVWGHQDWIWASGDLRVRPRDMAKLGQMYLSGGRWKGEQIVSADWVAQSGVPFHAWERDGRGRAGYGLAWWVMAPELGSGAYTASGWGDQTILVLPEHDMVVVNTGGSYYDAPYLRSHQIAEAYVLPSIMGKDGSGIR
jgi:CubicO group peptidase (beta-lactamase class C family)